MQLPKDQESRAQIIKAVVSLMRVPPPKRKEFLEAEKARRAKTITVDARSGGKKK